MKHIITFLLTVLLCSCSTLINGSDSEVIFTSQPSGAKVTVNGLSYGNTPASVILDNKRSYRVCIEMEGYEPYYTYISKYISNCFWGNCAFGSGFFIGMGIDAYTGAMYELSMIDVHAVLQKQQNTGYVPTGESGLFVFTTLNPDPSWKKIGQLTKL